MNRLEELRKEKGFSMREAAARLELAYTSVYFFAFVGKLFQLFGFPKKVSKNA